VPMQGSLADPDGADQVYQAILDRACIKPFRWARHLSHRLTNTWRRRDCMHLSRH